MDRETLDRLYSAAYDELKRLARTVRRGEAGQSLTTTGLVNEAWLKLAKSPGFASYSDTHFKRIVVRAMRQLLVESARRRLAAKRGGGLALAESIDGDLADETRGDEYVVALDDALERFAIQYPRQARTVEVRYFGGYAVDETATMLEISRATVERDCRFAKAWLATEVRP